jgi:hypothetical protein
MGKYPEDGKSTMEASPNGEVYPIMVDAQGTFRFREVGGTSKGNTQMCSLVLNYIKSFVAFANGKVDLSKLSLLFLTYSSDSSTSRL